MSQPAISCDGCATKRVIELISRHFCDRFGPDRRGRYCARGDEVDTARAERWLASQSEEAKLISWWVEVEWSAAINRKVASGMLDSEAQSFVNNAFEALVSASFTTLAVERSHFITAGLFAKRSPGLRAGDALHLAIAAAHEATVCTLDKAMAAAGRRLDLDVVLI